MRMNKAGVDLIKRFEGCRLMAYPDPGSGGDPITIGYGATGPSIKLGVVWSQAQADKRLEEDLNTFSNQVKACLTCTLSDNEFSAIVSLVYNIGIGNFKKSTMLKYLNGNAEKGIVAEQFLRWNKASGVVLNGLTRRRAAEKKLFLTA